MATELLVPEGAVHDLLGVGRPVKADLPMHITALNALGQKWVHRGDVLRWLNKTHPDLARTLREGT